jgi:hypothetical protein
MSAAATAAGYLYASGRLRAKKEEAAAEKGERLEKPASREHQPQARRPIKVAVYQREDHPSGHEPHQQPAPKRQPKIEYKTKRRIQPE